jgi:protein FRA10AC1
MRWRTIEEVKVGKGDKVCANIACGRNEGLEAMEVVFGYVEDGKKKDVLVKCVLCEKCERKMRKARNTGEKRRRRNRHREEVDDDGKREQTDDDARKRRRQHEEEHGKRHRRHQDEDPKKRRQSSSKDMSKDSHSKDGTDGSGKSRPRGSREH